MPRYTAKTPEGRTVKRIWVDGNEVPTNRAFACDTDEGWVDVYRFDGDRPVIIDGDNPLGVTALTDRIYGQVAVELETLQDFIEEARRGNTNERAAAMILEHAHASGQHHQRWLLDQVLRIIAGRQYGHMVALWQAETGHEWDAGIAP